MALRGLKVIELAGLAPAPVCGMVRNRKGSFNSKKSEFYPKGGNEIHFRGDPWSFCRGELNGPFPDVDHYNAL